MKRPIIPNGYAGYTGPNLISLCQKIKTGMSENFAAYPGLPAYIAKVDAYGVAYTAAQNGGATERALRDQAKEDLVNDMHQTAYWVMYTCNGDRALMLSSGFPVSKEENTPAPPVTAATNQKLVDGINPGVLDYSFKNEGGANNFRYEITPDPITPTSVWKGELGSKCKFSFTGLVSGQRYWARSYAMGKDGQCVCSEPISRISQ